jgi:hypothetical protein
MAGIVWRHRQQEQFLELGNAKGYLHDYGERRFGYDFFLGHVPIGRTVTLPFHNTIGAPLIPERLFCVSFPAQKLNFSERFQPQIHQRL